MHSGAAAVVEDRVEVVLAVLGEADRTALSARVFRGAKVPTAGRCIAVYRRQVATCRICGVAARRRHMPAPEVLGDKRMPANCQRHVGPAPGSRAAPLHSRRVGGSSLRRLRQRLFCARRSGHAARALPHALMIRSGDQWPSGGRSSRSTPPTIGRRTATGSPGDDLLGSLGFNPRKRVHKTCPSPCKARRGGY